VLISNGLLSARQSDLFSHVVLGVDVPVQLLAVVWEHTGVVRGAARWLVLHRDHVVAVGLAHFVRRGLALLLLHGLAIGGLGRGLERRGVRSVTESHGAGVAGALTLVQGLHLLVGGLLTVVHGLLLLIDLALCLRGRTLILSLELSEVDLRHGGLDHLDAGLLPRVPVVGLGLRVHLVLVGGAVGRGPNGTVGLHALAGRLNLLQTDTDALHH